MLVVYGTARVAAEDIDRLRSAAMAMVNASRDEPGCIEYAYAFDMFEPTLMRIIERWQDGDALKQHFSTPHMAAWRAALGSMGISDVELFTLRGDPEVLPR